MEEFIQQRVGQTLGERWVLQGVLGVGGMAAVYAATDAAGNEAAVKILHPEIARRDDLRERFLREGTVANRIQHAGAVRILEHGAVDDRFAFLVMERLQGESLSERVARDGSLPLPDLLDLLDQVLDVLAVAHAAGIIHRDLKPDNLFLTESGLVKVLDFGVARVLESAPDDLRTRTGMAMGTLPYMAPEQALGKRSEVDGRVDIFALGATAFRVLARRRIHEADSEAGLLLAMATKAAPPLASVAAHVPENVAAIVDLALAFDRDARYPDARTMQADVRAVQRAEAPPLASARHRARDEPTRAGVPVIAPPRTPTAVAVPSRPTPVAASAVTPPPAPSPWNVAGADGPATLPRVAAAPQVAAPATALAPQAMPLWMVIAGAVGCVLLGALLWLIWPTSQPVAAEAEQAPEMEDAAREREPKSAERERKRSDKQREKALKQQKKHAEREDDQD